MIVLAGKIGWVILVTAWYVIRYPFERRAKRTTVSKTGRDAAEYFRMFVAGSGLGLFPILFITSSLLDFADYDPSWAQIVLGAIVSLVSLVLFRLTHVALGRFWSVSLDIKKEHQLITTGIYRTLRHPMYTAFWLMALAQACFLANWVAGFSGLAGFGFLFFSRIGAEERMMETTFGLPYREYQSRTWRIIPFIW